MGTLPESFLFFLFVCSQASPSALREFLFTAALHLSQKGLADIQRIPKIKNPIYLTYQGRRAARFQTDDELEVLQVPTGGRFDGQDLMKM